MTIIRKHNNQCLKCNAKFTEPMIDLASGEERCPKCHVFLPQPSYPYWVEDATK